MASQTGFFAKSGSPAIQITVSGAVPGLSKQFDATIDTGFTGFLSIPLVKAFPLGLLLFSTVKVVLADGSTNLRLTAYGAVLIGSEARSGVIILEPNSDELLIGMHLLKEFGKRLTVCPTTGLVELADTLTSP
jgi:predicted aspartyl protease